MPTRRSYALPRFTNKNRIASHRFTAECSIANLYIPCSEITWWDDLTMRLCPGLKFIGWSPGGSVPYKAKDDSYAMMVEAIAETKWLDDMQQVWLHLDKGAMDDYWEDLDQA